MTTTNAERETHLNMTAEDRGTWEAASNDPVMIARLERIGAELVRTVGETRFYRLNAAQVLLRKGKRNISDETRQAMAQRLRALSTTDAKQENDE